MKGISLITFHNGEELPHHLFRSTSAISDIIFINLNIPEIDGKTCLRVIKEGLRLKDIAVIIYTTSAQQGDRKGTFELGAAYFLTKSSFFKIIREGIEKAIEIVSR